MLPCVKARALPRAATKGACTLARATNRTVINAQLGAAGGEQATGVELGSICASPASADSSGSSACSDASVGAAGGGAKGHGPHEFTRHGVLCLVRPNGIKPLT